MPEEIVTAALRPLQSAFSWLGTHASAYLRSWKLRKTLEAEYNRIVRENEQLIYDSMYNADLEAENANLRTLLGEANARANMNPVGAHVIAKESGNWFSMFTLDKGSADGLQTDMAVINQDGLIGRIYAVNTHTAEVITIIDSRSSIGGLIEGGNRDQGIVKGTLGVEESATCRMYYLSTDVVPRPGDVVVTSGVGIRFPKGLRIGVVRESTRHMDENKQYIVVEPYVKFVNLEEVLVLVYQPQPEDMPAANDGQLNYVPVPLDTYRPVPLLGDDTLVQAGSTPAPLQRPDRLPAAAGPAGEGLEAVDDLYVLDPDEPDPAGAHASPDPAGAHASPAPQAGADPLDDLYTIDPDEE
jgi:rod shape-determining protein MreC